MLALEHVALNNGSALGPSASRVWLLDMSSGPASGTVKPLFDDPQIVSNGPRWSPDGKRLAVYNLDVGGIVIHDFTANKDTVIKTTNGEVGQFSPDGRWMIFPKTVSEPDGGSLTHQVVVDLKSPYLVQSDLVPDSDLGDYREAIWMPDGKAVVVTRPSAGAELTGVPQVRRSKLQPEQPEHQPGRGQAVVPAVSTDQTGSAARTVEL